VYLQPNSLALCPDNNGQPSTREGCNAASAIVAVSGGDTRARTKHAVELYKHGWAPKLIFSGAAADKKGPSNALAMRQDAIAQGVPADAIIIEELSETTEENAAKTGALLKNNGITDIILVTSGYHMRRTSLDFSALTKHDGVAIRTSPTNDRDWGWWWWLTPGGWYLAVSEFAKVMALYAGGNL
jgi:uncharacterized SAM-binding protein YcdF (DUF218 family)